MLAKVCIRISRKKDFIKPFGNRIYIRKEIPRREINGYCVWEAEMKRIADWLEKISAGSILIGLYQNNMWAITIGFFTLLGSIYITRKYL